MESPDLPPTGILSRHLVQFNVPLSNLSARWAGCPPLFRSFFTNFMTRAVKGQDGRLVVNHGFDVHGTPPQLLQISQSVLRVVLLELDPAVLVEQVQFAAIPVVSVLDENEGPAVICEGV